MEILIAASLLRYASHSCYTARVSDILSTHFCLNGELLPLQPCSMLELLEHRGYLVSRVAVELNGEILPRSQFEHYLIQADDHIEVVHFVGGG